MYSQRTDVCIPRNRIDRGNAIRHGVPQRTTIRVACRIAEKDRNRDRVAEKILKDRNGRSDPRLNRQRIRVVSDAAIKGGIDN